MRPRLAILALACAALGCGASERDAPDAGLEPRSSSELERCEEPPASSIEDGSIDARDSRSPSARVLATADAMVGDAVVVRGGCYGYVEAVFVRAGYAGRADQVDVARAPIGERVDLDVIEPGDWLFLVNHPERTPVGTHSVLFVSWADRDAGVAKVVSYVGGSRDEPGEYVDYDVRRTYRVRRAREPE